MPKTMRALWQCPKCGREFANRNQWHGCTTLTLPELLKDKRPKAVALFRAFEEAVRVCGPVRVHANPSRIGFIARMTFAGAKLRKDAVEIGLILPYRCRSPRFHKFVPYRTGGLHSIWLRDLSDLDDELRGWLREAYRLGIQETPMKKANTRTSQPAPRTARTKKPAKRGGTSRRTGKIFYIHWNEHEAEERVAPLRAAGYDVQVHWNTQTTPKWGDYLPDAMVISQDRLPSHGRAYAGWLWEAKKRQHIPLIFVGGQPDKVQVARDLFPRAEFCTADDLVDVLNRVL